MAAPERHWRRIGWSIAAVIVLGSVSAACLRWQGSWPDSVAWLRGLLSTQTAADAYNSGDWNRAAELSRNLIKAGSGDPATLRIYARGLGTVKA